MHHLCYIRDNSKPIKPANNDQINDHTKATSIHRKSDYTYICWWHWFGGTRIPVSFKAKIIPHVVSYEWLMALLPPLAHDRGLTTTRVLPLPLAYDNGLTSNIVSYKPLKQNFHPVYGLLYIVTS